VILLSIRTGKMPVPPNKKAPTHGEKGRQNGCASLLIFPKPMMLELELAPDIEIEFNRLPWCHRASPSTTRHESVKSTDADKLMLEWQSVNRFFRLEDEPWNPSANFFQLKRFDGSHLQAYRYR
jgi:hypothetical protein